MDSPSSGGRGDSRFNMGYNISLLGGSDGQELYGAVHGRPSTSTPPNMGARSGLCCNINNNSAGSRGVKRSSNADVMYDNDGRQMIGDDVVDDGFVSPAPQKGSPPANGKKTKGRVKIKMEYIDNKLRRYTTFSKRKTGIMKKAYELSTLTGTQVMLLVASETGHVYTFATRKLQPMITSDAGKALIQTCLNSPDPCTGGGPGGGGGPGSCGPGGDQRMSATGFEETELSYNIATAADEEQKDERAVSPALSDAVSLADSSSCETPPSPPRSIDSRGSLKSDGRRSPPSHLPPPPHLLAYGSGNGSIPSRDGAGRSGRFPVGALAPGMVYSQPIDHQHSFLVNLNGAQHYLSFPVPIAPPTDLSKSSK